jgi:hypothetical protein
MSSDWSEDEKENVQQVNSVRLGHVRYRILLRYFEVFFVIYSSFLSDLLFSY